MREWLSGGASPCQGEGRGFDPRLALKKITDTNKVSVIFFESNPGLEGSNRLRSTSVVAKPMSPGHRATSRAS